MTEHSAERRSAIYTRKSSEEGLDQSFNSLDAQYEACAAYITSQRHEGWTLREVRYDDGGISGGTMKRPGLELLLNDIKTGEIDVVVVYKVDRLTRSLADFAKMVEVFDKHGVSFVSITQQFNTTSSMGRLTLNVLLSFAQFEREVTGERIRDKIAASKKKGMWMGGTVPLGYDVVDRKLVINEGEARTVRTLFQLYLDLKSVRAVVEQANCLGIRTKIRVSRNGNRTGGKRVSRGHLYWLLRNPVYTGRTRHGKECFPGEHQAIVDPETWSRAEAQLAANHHERRKGSVAKSPSLLAGLLFDAGGSPFTPSHAVKNGRRYRYYIDKKMVTGKVGKLKATRRLPASDIERVVINAVDNLIGDKEQLYSVLHLSHDSAEDIESAFKAAPTLGQEIVDANPARQREILLRLVKNVTIECSEVCIEIDPNNLRCMLGLPDCATELINHVIEIPAQFQNRGVEVKIAIHDSKLSIGVQRDLTLIRAIIRANDWWRRLENGGHSCIADLARSENLNERYLSRHLPLAFLAHDITEAILDGRQPADLSLEKIFRGGHIPLGWPDQRQHFGFADG